MNSTVARWEGYSRGTRVRAALTIVYPAAGVEVPAGTLGFVECNRPDGMYGRSSVLWDGFDQAFETSIDNLHALGF